MTRYDRTERIALLDELLDSLRTLLRDPSQGPRNRQALVTSAAICLDKLRAEEAKMTPQPQRDAMPSVAGRINFADEMLAVESELREKLKRGEIEVDT